MQPSDLPPMASATNGEVYSVGVRHGPYDLPNNESIGIAWNVSNISCLILSTCNSLCKSFESVQHFEDYDIIAAYSGSVIELVRRGGVPWMKLKRRQREQASSVKVSAISTATAIPDMDTDTVPSQDAGSSSAPAGAAHTAEELALAGKSSSAPRRRAMAAASETRRVNIDAGAAEHVMQPSAEALAPRGLTVPYTPNEKEKEEHYLTHIPFRNWCAAC